jgi:uncharacterized Zn-finger protein
MTKKLDISILQEYATKVKDGKLISTVYNNNYEKLEWECKEHHRWPANWSNIQNGKWCPICYYNNKIPTIYELQEHAISKGGKLISTEYINNATKLEWECGATEHHRWPATWGNVGGKQQTWCPYCNLNMPNISELQEHAISKGGKLISTEYINNATKLEWECEAPEHHRWPATWNTIHNGNTWCPNCNHNVPDIKVLQEYAINVKGGKLISTVYVGAKEKLEWECEEGHRWPAAWDSVGGHMKSWCPYCAKNGKPDISELQAHANIKEGKLISTEYINTRELLEWECKKGHRWPACWDSVGGKQQTWCPYCQLFKTEQKCREILEQLMNFRFEKKRFIYNNNRYEFDGYSKENKIAFEYHGYQHYIFPNRWHKTKEIFEVAQKRDGLKEEYCVLNNIKLIIIPYTEDENLEEYIKQLLIHNKLIP